MNEAIDNRIFADVLHAQQLPALQHSVSATTIVLGAMASRDWRPMHHDKDFAIARNGVRDIFLNTPSQAAWLERYITDWTGPKGRIGRMRFEMKNSIFPGEYMVISGEVAACKATDYGYGWIDLVLAIHSGERLASRCQARVALPLSTSDNPWSVPAEHWLP
mgnify:CR=1 FL=1